MLTQQQKENRKTGIGGSDAAAIVGKSKYATALDVYLNKIGASIKQEDDASKEVKERGNALESLVRRLYEIKTGNKVETLNSDFPLRSKSHDFMIGNIDGYVASQNIAVECKTAHFSMRDEWGEEGTHEMPEEYFAQCVHYSELPHPTLKSDHFDRVDVPVLFGSQEFFNALMCASEVDERKLLSFCKFAIYSYDRTERYQNELINVEKYFWNENVVKKVPPEPKNYKDVLKLFPFSSNKTVIARDDDLKVIDEIKIIKSSIRELEEKESSLKAHLYAFMQDASLMVGETGEKLITWKNQKNNRFNTHLFKEIHPELYAKFCQENETRVFRFN